MSVFFSTSEFQKISIPKTILGIDYGLKKIGISVSDVNKNIAFPLDILYLPKIISLNDKFDFIFNYISKIQDFKEISGFIIGWPLTLDGKCHELCNEISIFADFLSKYLPVLLYDERMTTQLGVRMTVGELSRKSNKNRNISKIIRKITKKDDDANAAAVILQCALDSFN